MSYILYRLDEYKIKKLIFEIIFIIIEMIRTILIYLLIK